MTTASTRVNRSDDGGLDVTSVGVLDGALYALFSRHADRERHDRDRRRYRATDVRASFGVYLSRVYGLSWVVFACTFVATGVVVAALPGALVASALGPLVDGLPLIDVAAGESMHRYAAPVLALLAAGAAKRTAVRLGGLHLRWSANARRTGIERTLPATVRYLRALAAGSDDGRLMLQKVARNPDAYGETAVACRKALNKATLTGSLGEGLQMVARDTPSQDALAPFLLKFREYANQGPDAVEEFLRMESRMLSHRQARTRERAEGFLELLAEMFIVLLVLPALLVIVLTVLSVLAPGLGAAIWTPVGDVTVRALVVYASAGFVLIVGAAAALLVGVVRPPDHSTAVCERPPTALGVLATASTNPASALAVCVPVGVTVGVALAVAGHDPVDAVLLGYAAFALPVGAISVRRARIDDAKDREIKDFVHAVSGHVSLGRPFSEAVEHVARDVDLGPLQSDVHDLAFNANLTTRDADVDSRAAEFEYDLRTNALDRFVDNVGTPLAEQSIGLVTGALDVGSDTEAVFETLQTEIGRLHHEKKALRATMLVYVAVGWTTALLVVGIMVAVNAHVLDGFAQLAEVSGSTTGFALEPNAVQPARDGYRFYVVTQATMLASGWFAGMSSRGGYEALLHSGALVVVAYAVFTGTGMV